MVNPVTTLPEPKLSEVINFAYVEWNKAWSIYFADTWGALIRHFTFQNLWADWKIILTDPLGFLPTVVSEIGNAGSNLASALKAIPLKIISTFAIRFFGLPKEYSYRVIKLTDVWNATAGAIAADGIDWIVNPFNYDHIPMVVAIESRISLFRKLTGLESFNFVKSVTKKVWFGLAGWLIALLEILWQVGGALALIFVLKYLRDYYIQALMPLALGQSAPRKRRRFVGGGSIYRRTPGGSPESSDVPKLASEDPGL